jgi:hypothetical protein
MLLGHIVLLVHVPLQRSEDARPLLEGPPALPLELAELVVCQTRGDVRPREGAGRGDAKVLELLAEDDNRLLGQQGVLRRVGDALVGVEGDGRLRVEETGLGGRAVKLGLGGLPELQDVLEAIWVKLRAEWCVATATMGRSTADDGADHGEVGHNAV